MMENFIVSQTKKSNEFKNQNLHMSEIVRQLASKFDSIATHNKMLDTQIFQVAQQQGSSDAPP